MKVGAAWIAWTTGGSAGFGVGNEFVTVMVAAAPVTRPNSTVSSAVHSASPGSGSSSQAYVVDVAPPLTVSLAVHSVPASTWTVSALVGCPVESKVMSVWLTADGATASKMSAHSTATVNVVPGVTGPSTHLHDGDGVRLRDQAGARSEGRRTASLRRGECADDQNPKTLRMPTPEGRVRTRAPYSGPPRRAADSMKRACTIAAPSTA